MKSLKPAPRPVSLAPQKFSPTRLLRSFKPAVGKNPKILILGTMPGPVALKVRQFYGFPGNHFWKIMADLFGFPREMSYEQRIGILSRNGIALWDVFESCEREGALDADITCVTLNDIPGLVKKHPTIRALFLNGGTAYSIYRKNFEAKIEIPSFRMPSTSPAHAAMSYEQKKKAWSGILKYL